MNRVTLATILQEISALAATGLKEIDKPIPSRAKSSVAAIKIHAGTPGSLADCLLKLRGEGLFSKPKSAREVHDKLSAHYPCDLNRVAVGLLRLQKKRELRRTFKGAGSKKQVAYVQ
ncbi:MAG: hypothetical protein ACLQDV_05495 [Candidatus Binataceae bacterium]